MATTTTMPAPEARATIGPVGRIVGVFFSPKATFEDIVRKPSWLIPVVLMTVLSTLAGVVFVQRANWREYISQQIEKNPSTANMSAEQKEQRIEGGVKIAPPFTLAAFVLAPILSTLLVALVMWGAYNLLGGAETTFGTSFGITAHANLTGLVGALLLLLILFLKPVGTVDIDNPLAANVAAFLPEDSAKWLVSLGKSIDLFSFWTMALLAIGFGATNPRKLRGSKAFTIVLSVWAVYVVLKVGAAFITG
jgi:hypothetical protein